MNVKRKLTVATVTIGVLFGAIAVAAPASAITEIGCPTAGVEVYSDHVGNFCYGGLGDGYANIANVYRVSSGVNSGVIVWTNTATGSHGRSAFLPGAYAITWVPQPTNVLVTGVDITK